MFLNRRTTPVAGGAGLLLAAVAVAGCGGTAASGPPKTAGGTTATVGVSDTSLGTILVNSTGRTLYLFTGSSCTGACAVNWPPLLVPGKPAVGTGAKASLVSTTSTMRRQLTYNGHPLYLFKGDSKPGQTKGEGVNAFGGNWFAVSPAGARIAAPVAAPGGGNGY